MSKTSGLSVFGARVILIGLAILVVWGIWRPLPRQGAAASEDRTDSSLYSVVIGHVKSGESYYSALGAELVKGDYPTDSVFN